MKRIVLGLVASLAFTTSAAAHTLYPKDPEGLRLRQGPGTTYPIITVLTPDQGVKVLGREGDWYKVQTRDGQTAWAAAWVARLVYDDEEAWAEITGDNLNVRKGPGTQYAALTQLNSGDRVRLLEVVDDWWRIRLADGREAWIAGMYARESAAPDPAPAPGDPAPTRAKKGVSLAVSRADVRRGSHPGYDALDTVRSGEPLQYLDAAGGWVQVATPRGVRGWIPGGQVALWDQGMPFLQAPSYRMETNLWQVANLPLRVVSDPAGLRLRSGPGTDHDILLTMPRSTVMRVLQVQGEWAQVLLADGNTGWCAVAYTSELAISRPRLRSATLRAAGDGVVRVEVEGQLQGARVDPLAEGNGLLIAIPDSRANPAHLQVADRAIRALEVTADGVLLRFESSPAYTVVEQSAGRLVLELRPAVLQVEEIAEPGRVIYRLPIAGEIRPRTVVEGDQVVLELPGALLKAAQLPAGMQAQATPEVLRLRLATRSPFLLKRSGQVLEWAVLEPGLAGKVIMLDPGHGGVETGAVSPVTGLREKDANLAVALYLTELLEASGATVLMTRDTDRRATPPEILDPVPESERLRTDLDYRTRLANQARVDLFLSIHANGGVAGDAGTETFWTQTNFNAGRSRELATLIQDELVRTLGRRDRGVKTDIFYVIRYTEAPAALAELAFVSHPDEAVLLGDIGFQQASAQALFRALSAYFAAR